MQCIQTENKGVDMFGVGKHGFQAGNPGAGTLATYVSPDWCNGVQEEILNVIRAGGLVPSGDFSQLLQSLVSHMNFRTGGPGRVQAFARITAPDGWLECDGSAVSRTTYAALFAAIGVIHGAGDGATTFNVPDLRGEFLRGWDHGRGVDAARVFGSAQAQQMLTHTHTITDPGHGHLLTDSGHGHSVSDPGHIHGVTDPGHLHSTTVNKSNESASTDPWGSGGGTAEGTFTFNSDSATTGVTINSAGTGITLTPSNAGITLTPSATSITINNAGGGAELRPRNVALLYCISYA